MRPAIDTSRFFVLPDVADADAAKDPFQPGLAAEKPKRFASLPDSKSSFAAVVISSMRSFKDFTPVNASCADTVEPAIEAATSAAVKIAECFIYSMPFYVVFGKAP